MKPPRPVLDAVAVTGGLLLFAGFVHDPWPSRTLAVVGLLLAAGWIGFSSGDQSLLHALGLTRPGRRAIYWTIPAVFLGSLLAILTRNRFEISLLPHTIGIMVLVAPCIGAMEEVVFRGYIQGSLRLRGRALSILATALAHTGYKLLVILTLPGPGRFDPLFLGTWTFLGGTAFGITRDFSKSTIPPLTAHVIFDILLYGGLSTAPAWVWS